MEPDIQIDWNRVAYDPARANRIYFQISSDYLYKSGEDPMEFSREFDAYFKHLYGYNLPLMIPDTSDMAIHRLEAFVSFANLPREFSSGWTKAA